MEQDIRPDSGAKLDVAEMEKIIDTVSREEQSSKPAVKERWRNWRQKARFRQFTDVPTITSLRRIAAAGRFTHKDLLLLSLAVFLLTPLVAYSAAYWAAKSAAPAAVASAGYSADEQAAMAEKAFFQHVGTGNMKEVEASLAAGMNPDIRRYGDRYTPLLLAAHYGNVQMAKQLLAQGADINAKDSEGEAALIKAVYQGHTEMVELLTAGGADVNAKDRYGMSALDIANRKKLMAIALHLERQGAAKARQDAKVKERPLDQTRGLAEELKSVSSQAAAPVADEYLLRPGKAGPLAIGMPADAARRLFTFRKVAGAPYVSDKSEALAFYLTKSGEPSLVAACSPNATVSGIRVYDEQFKTESRVGVNSTLGMLRQKYASAVVRYRDTGVLEVLVEDLRMSFELDVRTATVPREWLITGNSETLPNTMKIRTVELF